MISGQIETTFVRGGVKNNRPYLMVSNGLEAKFVNIGDKSDFTEQKLASYEKGDVITLSITADALEVTATGIVD